MSDLVTIHFGDGNSVTVPAGAPLAEHLDASNSPLLFGCRTGICGTCLVKFRGEAPAPDEEELEIIDLFADGDPDARLACQLKCTTDVHVTPHPEAP